MNNNFYILKYSVDNKIIGKTYPQSQSMSNDYNYAAENSCWKMAYDSFPEFEPNLNGFLLHKTAKLTDVISNASIYFGLLISNKLAELLTHFELPKYKLFKAYIIQKSESHNYNFFHYISDLVEYIDFEKTRFYLFNGFERTNVFIHSKNDLLKLYNEIPTTSKLKTDKYQFIKGYKMSLDLFQISITDSRTYISHRLKTALEEAKITGIEITPVDFIVPVMS